MPIRVGINFLSDIFSQYRNRKILVHTVNHGKFHGKNIVGKITIHDFSSPGID